MARNIQFTVRLSPMQDDRILITVKGETPLDRRLEAWGKVIASWPPPSTHKGYVVDYSTYQEAVTAGRLLAA